MTGQNNNKRVSGVQSMTETLPETIYTSHSQLRHPAQFLRHMGADLRASRSLAWRLLLRDIRSQYRQSLLGYLWIVLPALATTLTWVMLNKMQLFRIDAVGVPYPVYVLAGTLLWQGFSDALNSPFQQMASSESLLTKVNFPRETLLISGLGGVLFNLAVRLVMLFGVLLLFRVPLTPLALLAPVGVMALLLFGTALGLLLAPLGTLYHDVQRGLTIALNLWFFVTPVVYPVPTSWPAVLLARLNPVSPLLVTTRELLVGSSVSHWPSFLLVASLLLPLLFVALVLFRLAMPHVIARMKAG